MVARGSRLSGLRAVGREAAALARQVTLLPRDLRRSVPLGPIPGGDVVVLVHGLFATAGVLRPLRTGVAALTGAATASFSHAPGLGVAGIAKRLGALLESLPAGAALHLVGHSLGGLAIRWYVEEARDARVVQTISLATPFNGTRHARLMPGAVGRELLPGSPVLERLRAARGAVEVPHLSVVAEHDRLITELAAAPFGEVRVVEGVGHNGLLYAPEVVRLVAGRVLRYAANAAPVAAE